MIRRLLVVATVFGLACQSSGRPTDPRQTSAPPQDPWPDHARAIVDSVHVTLIAYGNAFHAADRDSLERFYVEDPAWRWAADGRVGTPSILMVRSRLDGLARYPRWRLTYTNLAVTALAPGLAALMTDYRMRFSGGKNRPLDYAGALTTFWKNGPSGWKMVGGHSSTLASSQ